MFSYYHYFLNFIKSIIRFIMNSYLSDRRLLIGASTLPVVCKATGVNN